jgi:glycosyltransferase involved in cell wall biosynthesis
MLKATATYIYCLGKQVVLTVRISIITVTRNAAAHLEKCIQSIAAQTHLDSEYIIVDGDSTDGTSAIVERHRACVAQFVSEPDDGLYHAMNKGIARATGDYVFFLGADDYLYDRDVMRDVARFLAAHPEVDFAYGNIAVRSAKGRESVFRPPPPNEALRFLVCGCLPHQASFARRDIFERLGPFDLRYKIAADYDWFLRVLASPESQIRYFDRVVTSYFVDGLSNDLARSQAEVFSIQNAFPGYQTEEGHLIRIAEYQRNLTHYRIELQKAEGRLREANRRPTGTVPLRRVASAALAHSPHWLANCARALRGRA